MDKAKKEVVTDEAKDEPSSNELPPGSAAQVVRQELLRRLGKQWVVGQWLPPVAELARILASGHVSTHRAVVQLTREGYLLPLRGKGTRVLKTSVDTNTPEAHSKGSVSVTVPYESSSAGSQLPGLASLTRSPRIAIVRARNTDPMIHRMVDSCMEAAMPMSPQFFFILNDGETVKVTLTEKYDVVVLFNMSNQDDLSGVLPFADHIVRVTTGQANRHHAQLSDVVTVDQRAVGALAGKCFKDIGLDSVCFFGKKNLDLGKYDTTSKARLRGFEIGWGRKLNTQYMMYGQFYGQKTGRFGYLRWTKLSPRPQGIFAASDELAIGVLAEAVLEGLVPGVDFHLIGVDGQERFRNSTGFPLTSIQMPADAMGRQAARMIRQRLMEGENQPMRVVLPCSLYQGQTVRSAANQTLHAAETLPQAQVSSSKSSRRAEKTQTHL